MNLDMNTVLFALYPYIAIAVCVVGCWIRFDREQYTWRAGSSQLMRTRGMVIASNCFHIGILFILFGHFFGLLTPASLYHHVITTEQKQLLAIVSGGAFGLLCLVGLLMLLHRRIIDPRVRATGTNGDLAILVLLCIQLLLGLATIFASVQHMDGSVMLLLAGWAQSVVTLQPAQAAALRSRLWAESASLYGFNVFGEFDNVSVVGADDYNSTENGKTRYPVVADPKGTEVNQVYLKYTMDSANGIYGRQRINYSNQRFVGGVAWRQNEQTFDGFRGNWQMLDNVNVDYSYAYRVHRVFGPDDGANPAEWSGDNNFVYVDWKVAEGHQIGAFAYIVDVDSRNSYPAGKTVNNSSESAGLEYIGNVMGLRLRAAYARQSDAGDSELDYDANYYLAEVGGDLGPVSLTGGYEVLAAGDGVGFATPLATLHKFQGWADKFLSTPADGVEDMYLKVSGKVGPVNLEAVYHDFQAEDSSRDYGTEVDLAATWPVNKLFTTQLKYAGFSADNDNSGFTDTDKLWITLQLKI